MKTLIIPDIHGKTFWKEATEQFLTNNEGIVVFLGDYFDPYKGEGISQEDAINNFDEIINFNKKHGNNVVLLIGNHDLHYIFSDFEHCSRFDFFRGPRIRKRFADNLDKMQLAYSIKDNGKNIILSHAGIQKNWINECFGKKSFSINDDNVVDYLNESFIERIKNPESLFAQILDIMSPVRGGFFHEHGSVVWADCTEYLRRDTEIYGDYQIFGHTRVKEPFLVKNWACLDCCRPFLLEDAVLRELDGTILEIKNIKD